MIDETMTDMLAKAMKAAGVDQLTPAQIEFITNVSDLSLMQYGRGAGKTTALRVMVELDRLKDNRE